MITRVLISERRRQMGQGRGGDMIIKAEEAEVGVMRLLEVVG